MFFKSKSSYTKFEDILFQESFEKWLTGYSGLPYQEQILNAKSDDLRELAKDDAERAFARANPHLLPDDYRDASKTRIRPVRHARLKGVDDLSFDVIEPGLNQLGLVSASIMRNWESIVGSALAQNTRAERVTFPPKSRTHGSWRPGRTSMHDTHVHSRKSFLHGLPVDIFCQHISRAVSTQDLQQFNLLGSDFVLNPKISGGQVPDLTKTFASTYADGGSRTGVHPELELPANVIEEALHSEALCCAMSNPVEFSFTTR